jgi:hypothetical protein
MPRYCGGVARRHAVGPAVEAGAPRRKKMTAASDGQKKEELKKIGEGRRCVHVG